MLEVGLSLFKLSAPVLGFGYGETGFKLRFLVYLEDHGLRCADAAFAFALALIVPILAC